ncbi:MAG: LysM peptidoglycan-binding domain-containing protein [Bacteroidia bacterium]|nr:LysM peptidoglycan-binding domain-containing protein [Bacteroidia bacterium]
MASDIIANFCKQHQCAFYDWYWIAGGRYSMVNWRNNNLANKDFIHLTSAGYKQKGQMIAEAYLRTYDWLQMNDTANRWVHNIDSLTHPPVDTTKKQIDTPVTYGWVYHKVRSGQTIWTIANSYHVTGAQIRQWNRLRSNYLYLGQVLKIYTKLSNPAVATPTTPTVTTPNAPKVTPKPNTPKKPAPVYHKVRSGETLYSIAQKHRTTVNEIKRLSGIRSNNIRIGQVLRVK